MDAGAVTPLNLEENSLHQLAMLRTAIGSMHEGAGKRPLLRRAVVHAALM